MIHPTNSKGNTMKKLSTLGAIVLITLGVAIAGAAPAEATGKKVTICHATGSQSNPYVLITVNQSAVDGEGKNDHTHHEGDIIPAPKNSEGKYECPKPTPPTTEPPTTTEPPVTTEPPPVTTEPPTTEPPTSTTVTTVPTTEVTSTTSAPTTTAPSVTTSSSPTTTETPVVSIGTAPPPPSAPTVQPTTPAPGGAPSSATLPSTGSETWIALLAAGFLAAGLGITAATRRR